MVIEQETTIRYPIESNSDGCAGWLSGQMADGTVSVVAVACGGVT